MDILAQLSEFMINHWMLWGLLALILLALWGYDWQDKQRHAVKISPSDAVRLINHEDAAILDIRSPDAFRQGHVLHAMRVKPEDYTTEDMQALKDKPVILVCQRGITAYAASAKWRAAGFKALKVLAGGMEAWQSEGLPLVKGN